MKLYKDNRTDREYDKPNTELVVEFWQKVDPSKIGNMDRAVRVFLMEYGTWIGQDDNFKSYNELLDMVLAAWPRDTDGNLDEGNTSA